MSDLITSTQEATRAACIALFFGVQNLGRSMAERAKDPTGQTAAEYMGVLFVISAIIAAVIALHIEKHIATGIKDIVDHMGGKCPEGDC